MAECTTTAEGCAVTVTVQLEPMPLDSERLQDIAELSGLFFVAALVIFCARRLLDLFRVSHHDD